MSLICLTQHFGPLLIRQKKHKDPHDTDPHNNLPVEPPPPPPFFRRSPPVVRASSTTTDQPPPLIAQHLQTIPLPPPLSIVWWVVGAQPIHVWFVRLLHQCPIDFLSATTLFLVSLSCFFFF